MNEFCWMDVKTRDVPGVAAFFGAVLGWRFAVDENDPRRATKIYLDGYPIGGVSDLSDPIYPPGTPPHVAYYLAVDDADRVTGAAVANGAELVVRPFDAGDQGRMATLVDPGGAAFSPWQAGTFAGWRHPGLAHAPARMMLACNDPERSRAFYRTVLGAEPRSAEFVRTPDVAETGARWEAILQTRDPGSVAARARTFGGGACVRSDAGSGQPGGPVLRLTGPDGLAFQMRPVID
ncbi:VOC family protein [Actinomadura rudentiformis]|uniref:VOC family protein n=1 Tax=Actinomadura rudentiformis TaxID=359158 RepID=UPI001CEF9A75|nr:VOC family protein [Actinomadura rudentiformis]